ncbi:MAG TPA: DNA-processing protein DprA [Candidatus Paceibacterota bacterium]|nr:DNA-processing protein DprA [Candidatus Paceibacterota bacterium]
MDEEKMFYNAVALALSGNPAEVRSRAKKTGGSGGGWKALYETLASDGRSPPDPEAAWRELAEAGIGLVFREEPGFPHALRHIHDPPFALYVRGALPRGKRLAIVGTRRATAAGKTTAMKFGRELARGGFAIVSGLALGIDAAAHEGCLAAANGKAIAVLAGGLDRFYPEENAWLGRKVLAGGGAIVSEYPLREPCYPDRFLERNRIISGLSEGTLVIECPDRSGSLATARFAFEQNRDLFVVPGPITHANFSGSHALIRQGAELVTKPEDIFEAYAMAGAEPAAHILDGANEAERLVLLALADAAAPASVDKIIAMTKLEPQAANRTLSFLVLKELVKETEAGYIIE